MVDNTTSRPAVASITEAEIQDGKTMAILAYIIFLIPLFAARDKKFAMFHTEQVLVLIIVWVVIWIVFTILSIIVSKISSTLGCGLSIISILIWVAYLILWIMGIINAATGKVKELPIIGSYGAKLNLVK
ncbi:MAG: hypothetical protein ABSF32_08210 [Ignavibacteria bacterium]|jgi:uncharacterized membrane protein